MYALIIQHRALDKMAYFNIIMLSNPSSGSLLLYIHSSLFLPCCLSFVFPAVLPSFLTYSSRCPCSHHPPFYISCRCVCLRVCMCACMRGGGEVGEVLKETSERYRERRVMNLPAVCNTLRFVNSSPRFWPKSNATGLVFAVPTHTLIHTRAHTHLPPPSPLLAIAVCRAPPLYF